MKRLLFFTSQYPSRTGDGNFIKNEIQALSEGFDKIYIARLSKGSASDTHELPDNVEVVFDGFVNKKDIIKRGVFNTTSVWVVCKLFFNDVLKVKSITHLQWFILAILIGRGVYSNTKIKELLNKYNSDDLDLYFFWGTGMSYLIPWLGKFSNKINVKFHGGDLYINRRGYIPFRKAILSRANKLITISNDGKLYLQNLTKKMKIPSDDKVFLIRLGTLKSEEKLPNKNVYKEKVIVSCSSITPVKRLLLIHKVIVMLSKDINVRWIHFGDGIQLGALKKQIKAMKSEHLVAELRGYTHNNKVLEFYKVNTVDLFINLSSSEGIPVSIMEAISFNIPVLATNVGGSKEIVGENFKTGILVQKDEDIEKIVDIVKQIFKRNDFEPKKYWQKHFCSIKNSRKLVKLITG